MVDIVSLVSTSYTTDDYGDRVLTETSRVVFCAEQSVGAREFYEAQAVGQKPEVKVILQDYLDYAGEKLADYKGLRYDVLRTYRTGNALELTLTRQVNEP